MGRASLLLVVLLLASPSLALAQTAGQVVVSTGDGDDALINIAECAGVGGTGDFPLAWNVAPATTTVNGGVFKIFASNKAPTVSTTGPTFCPDDGSDSGATHTVQIGEDVPAGTQTTGTADRPTAAFAAAAQIACEEASNGKKIHVCVEYHPDSATGRIAGAVGELTLELRRPAAPDLFSVAPGESALHVDWNAGDSSGVEYEVFARSVDPAFLASLDPTTLTSLDPVSLTTVDSRDGTLHSSGRIRAATDHRLSGLVNDVTYTVAVVAFSAADNESLRSRTLQGKAQASNDFWETYLGAGGLEEGGCASGAAGPVALLAAAALLLLRRRR